MKDFVNLGTKYILRAVVGVKEGFTPSSERVTD